MHNRPLGQRPGTVSATAWLDDPNRSAGPIRLGTALARADLTLPGSQPCIEGQFAGSGTVRPCEDATRNKVPKSGSVGETSRSTSAKNAAAPAGELGEPGRQRLRCALALTLGTEALIAMKDSAGLDDDEEIVATLGWAASALLRTALHDFGGSQ
jgi:hypothetical protein